MNSNESVKSRGVVVLAFNTDKIDYVKIADRTSQLIAHSLKLPITLITDPDSKPEFAYDCVVRVTNDGKNFRTGEFSSGQAWRNFGRYRAYELSPYNETILLDTDYLVLDDSLLNLFETDFDYKLMHRNKNESGLDYEQMGQTSLPFVWATVVLFRKTPRSQLFFSLVGRIQRNYEYYRALYNVRDSNFRNDFAFAIANNILSGYTTDEVNSIPWAMFTLDKPIESIEYSPALLKVKMAERATIVPLQNIHIMDKSYLLTNHFSDLVKAHCESI